MIAEFARVPFAEESLIPLPINHSTRSLSQETAYITLSDILATGWQSLDHAGFTPGDSVAIFGAGPVGLLATLSARFRGASRVFLIDRVPSRLRTGASLGAIPIDFAKGDPVGQIRQYTPDGVQRAVDCVGMEAVDEQGRRDPSVVIHNMQRVVARGGGLGQVGVYEAQNNTLAAPLSSEISPDVAIDLSSWFQQGLSFRTGIVDPKALAPHLLSLLQQKRLDPNFLTTAVISIEDAPLYYRRSSNHEETKVFIRFPRGREKNE